MYRWTTEARFTCCRSAARLKPSGAAVSAVSATGCDGESLVPLGGTVLAGRGPGCAGGTGADPDSPGVSRAVSFAPPPRGGGANRGRPRLARRLRRRLVRATALRGHVLLRHADAASVVWRRRLRHVA